MAFCEFVEALLAFGLELVLFACLKIARSNGTIYPSVPARTEDTEVSLSFGIEL